MSCDRDWGVVIAQLALLGDMASPLVWPEDLILDPMPKGKKLLDCDIGHPLVCTRDAFQQYPDLRRYVVGSAACGNLVGHILIRILIRVICVILVIRCAVIRQDGTRIFVWLQVMPLKGLKNSDNLLGRDARAVCLS